MGGRSEIEIVPITPDHIEGFHRAVDMVARERKYLALLEARPLAETRDFVMGVIRNGDIQLVALQGGEVVGWCDIRRHPFPSQAHAGTFGIGIIPHYRGRGLGMRLTRAALERGFATGLKRIELHVRADNARAVALYRKVGFELEGVLRDAVAIDGKYYDSMVMAIVRAGTRA